MAQKRSAAFMLFKAWVFFRVPEYATITQYAREEHGLFLPEDPKKRNALLLNMKPIYLHPSDAAEYLATGGALDINDPNDGIKVYGWIMEHLSDWLKFLETPQLFDRDVPIEGLRQFNVLASKLFPVANRYGYFKKPEVTMGVALQSLFGQVRLETQQHRFNDTIMKRIEIAYRLRGGR
ncbi:hypothetical protein pEaSNUABM29_00098 [Erwinia phage pEa_SNUABM_29]|nr:hypothetical protein pEaSNUABM29_00098 [Erwinia phage pEa_SNUABM_29]